jgi:4-aminobutyrate aminotransferase-like enzyme
MLGVDLGDRPGAGSALQQRLLTLGYITSTGGGRREVLVLTPPLNIHESLLDSFVEVLTSALLELRRGEP